jgi:hypothetical protein
VAASPSQPFLAAKDLEIAPLGAGIQVQPGKHCDKARGPGQRSGAGGGVEKHGKTMQLGLDGFQI